MKKITIGVVSSSQSLVDATRELAIERDLEVQSAYAGLDDAIKIAKQMESDGVEVLLARGGTAVLTRKYIHIPILSFPLSTIDILRCIKDAASYGRNILLVSFGKKMKGIEFVNEMFNIRLTQSVCKNFDDMQKLISTHYRKYDALVGGSTTSAIASKYGLEAIETHTPEDAIDTTLDSAISVAKYNRIEQEKSHRFSLIIDGVSDGVIAYDHGGNVTLINDTANMLLGVDPTSQDNRFFHDLLPHSKGIKVISSRKPIRDKIERVGSDLFVFNHIPIIINEESVGGVTTFKDASNVMEVEGKIRRSLSKGLVAKYDLSDLVCESREMTEVVKRIKRFASTNSTLLVVGETGTGKELLAQSIHNLSDRAKQAFVSINCAALSEELLQSELFGYEEGAFTGSRKGGKPGLFELAHNGTIFLDEINATSQNVQRHLLRVLQEQEVMRIGADRITPVNVRVIAASNKELVEEVNNGRFREDLFFRLNVLNVHIPPLRGRREDIPFLVDRFMADLAMEYKRTLFDIPEQNVRLLMEHNWPGNVRQLRNFVARLLLICDSDFDQNIFIELYEELFDYKPKGFTSLNGHLKPVAAMDQTTPERRLSERETMKKALEISGYSKTKAARLLGMSRTTLWKKLKKYDGQP